MCRCGLNWLWIWGSSWIDVNFFDDQLIHCNLGFLDCLNTKQAYTAGESPLQICDSSTVCIHGAKNCWSELWLLLLAEHSKSDDAPNNSTRYAMGLKKRSLSSVERGQSRYQNHKRPQPGACGQEHDTKERLRLFRARRVAGERAA